MEKSLTRNLFLLVLGFILSGAPNAFAAERDLMSLPLEDLLNISVTSAGGREQKKNEVSQSMTVITKEDIARSGARNIPDLFFMVPGMQVQRIDGHHYAVAVRGPSYIATNNLLVLIDGAVVFDSLSNGTMWDSLPVSLNEIERIEIIRGPGGVLYASNAVNGVINIITKSSLNSENYAAAKAGIPSIEDLAIAVGGLNAQKSWGVRVFSQFKADSGYTRKYKDPTNTFHNNYRDSNGGMRFDKKFSDDMQLSITAGLDTHYASDIGPSNFGPVQKYLGGMELVTMHFQQKVTDFYDYSIHADVVHHRGTLSTTNNADENTENLQMQNNLTYSFYGPHVTSFGVDGRFSQSNIQTEGTVIYPGSIGALNPAFKDPTILSFFLQDEYRPIEKLILTAGARIDENSYTREKDPLISPRASAIYEFTDTQSVRAVAQKTYHTPSIADKYMSIFIPSSGVPYPSVLYTGNVNLEPESVMTYETGYHGLFLDKKLDIDATAYLSYLKDAQVLSNWTPTSFYPFPFSAYPSAYTVNYFNDGRITTLGAEFDAKYNISKDFMVMADYSYIAPQGDPDSNSRIIQQNVNYVSTHAIGTGLRYTLNKWSFDAYAKYFSKYTYEGGYFTPVQNGTNQKMHGYWDNTLRLGYTFKIGKNDAEAELVGQNIFGSAGLYESFDQYLVKPEVYAGMKVKF
ncbi:MAG: TonB-dependent receptor [Candidatus Omnitrophica bacterium]|nr:TonB-dependent receptor [Candidatus Omnitrophota bacterium]